MATVDHWPVNSPDFEWLRAATDTLQREWLLTIQTGLEELFENDANVLVASNLPWYPIEGMDWHVAPGVMVVFGRPKGRRDSYRQWVEGGIAPQVVFDVLSPSHDWAEARAKRDVYYAHRIEEHYLFDPLEIELYGWQGFGTGFKRSAELVGTTSPRLGIRFDIGGDLEIFGPDGRQFQSFVNRFWRRMSAQQCREWFRSRLTQAESRAQKEHERAERYLALLRERGIAIDGSPPG